MFDIINAVLTHALAFFIGCLIMYKGDNGRKKDKGYTVGQLRTCYNQAYNGEFCCSKCSYETYQGEQFYNYCPNCGAKIDE